MQFLQDEHPDSYENALKVHNNLFKYGYRHWYDWSIANWGTKRDVSDAELIRQDPEHLILTFDSAWSPPVYGLDIIAGLFPELDFYIEFEEPMGGFRGYAHWMQGELIEEHCEDWSPFEECEEVAESSNLSLQQNEELSCQT